jgi:hypothetical protein
MIVTVGADERIENTPIIKNEYNFSENFRYFFRNIILHFSILYSILESILDFLNNDPILYNVNPCIVDLPGYEINMNQIHPATNAFFNVWFSGITGDYDVENGVHYDGWCIDHDTPLPTSNTYSVMLYSSYCPPPKFTVDSRGNTVNWGKINHIINHKIGSVNDIQAAIRYFVNFGDNDNVPGPDNQANYESMINNAYSSYVPGAGDVVAVIVDTNPDMEMVPEHPYQYLIVEIPVPETFEGLTPGFWKNKGVRVGWPSPYIPKGASATTLEQAGFIIPDNSMTDNPKRPVYHDDTLLEALNYKGGEGISGMAQILLRAATAALLNAAHTEVNYPLSVAEVISQVNSALATEDRDTMELLKNDLDSYNNLGANEWW